MRARHGYAILCLYGALISVELPMAGCAHRGGALDIQDPNAVRRFQLEKIALRTPVMVELHDGKVERGSYNGVGRLAPAAYATRFEAWLARRGPLPAPVLGRPLKVRLLEGGVREGVFEGFDYGAVRLRGADSAETEVVPFDGIATIGDTSATLAGAFLDQMLTRGELPVISTVRLTHEGRLGADPNEIPLDQVASIRVHTKNGWVAAAILVTLVGVVVVVSLDRPKPKRAAPDCSGYDPGIGWLRTVPAGR